MSFYNNRRTVLLGLVIFLSSAAQLTAAQVSNENDLIVSTAEMETKVDKIVEKGTTLAEFLNGLEKEFNVNFFYKSENLTDKSFSKRYSISPGKSLGGILSNVLPNFGLEYKALTSSTVGIFKEGDKFEPESLRMQVVSGTVTEASSGSTLPSVNVTVKGSPTIGTSTDADGNYSLEVPSLQDTLRFSFVGFRTREVPINGRTTIDVELTMEAVRGQEVVVSGYQTQQRSDVTGSISSVDADLAFAGKSVNNPIQSLQGQVAGMFVSASGDPSGEDTQVNIRGISTLNDNSPLYVIDGHSIGNSYVEANKIVAPNDIDYVRVLKGPDASIYGVRGANGVIEIVTRKV
jgi:TonB-dependent SusC/RagA subfamily outer membrane receptor